MSLLLAAAAPSPMAQVDTTRATFAKCLRDHLKKSLDAKMPDGEYEMAIKSVCEDERAAFRTAVIALDRSGGDSEAAATQDADEQIEEYRDNFVEKYKDYNSSNTMPSG